jgi:YegS/Rv2252/BmrU family lipid kinase
MNVAVIAHAGKTLGGGLPELRRLLARHGVDEPLWIEVPKAKRAPEQVRRALDQGADLVFSWGGDGMARRCLGELAGTDARLAILPAGTSNLLARNLGVPLDLEGAVEAGLRGPARRIDVGRLNDERFAVMAGVGFDAAMIRDADAHKDRFGRGAYVWSSTRNLGAQPFGAQITVDGVEWFEGPVSCILSANVGRLFGGMEIFPDAAPDNGTLELGIVTAQSTAEWVRTVARAVGGDPSKSPFVRITRVRAVQVELERKTRYELDGGDRSKVRRFQIQVEPGALQVCVPESTSKRQAA